MASDEPLLFAVVEPPRPDDEPVVLGSSVGAHGCATCQAIRDHNDNLINENGMLLRDKEDLGPGARRPAAVGWALRTPAASARCRATPRTSRTPAPPSPRSGTGRTPRGVWRHPPTAGQRMDVTKEQRLRVIEAERIQALERDIAAAHASLQHHEANQRELRLAISDFIRTPDQLRGELQRTRLHAEELCQPAPGRPFLQGRMSGR